jgi:Domain of unknown function (DUF5597)/Beta-galactosidase
LRVSLWIVVSVLAAASGSAADQEIPHLRRQGTAVQLVVDGQPFLIRGGELGNSSASNSSYLQPFWARFAELNLNTVLAPVYWDLVEPEEGRFDFSLLDRLVAQARAGKMRLVLLWFGSWKNSMSCYAPAWVKRDTRRFPRATDVDGTRPPPPSGGLVLSTGPDELVIAGTAVTITFASTAAGKRVGIQSAEEGRFVAGRFENVRWLNGDETHQGRHIRFEPGRFSLQRVRLYVY